MSISEILGDNRIVPVVVLHDSRQAEPLAEALLDSGMNCIEITLRSTVALECIENIAAALPQLVVGAGSLRHAEQMTQVKNSGARFGVSPGFSQKLLQAASAAGLPLVPGAATASESLQLLEAGYEIQKFFPAEILGGVRALQSLGGPLPEISYFPTGGITAKTAPDYLSLPNVRCIGGTWIAPAELVSTGNWTEIRRRAADALALVEAF